MNENNNFFFKLYNSEFRKQNQINNIRVIIHNLMFSESNEFSVFTVCGRKNRVKEVADQNINGREKFNINRIKRKHQMED